MLLNPATVFVTVSYVEHPNESNIDSKCPWIVWCTCDPIQTNRDKPNRICSTVGVIVRMTAWSNRCRCRVRRRSVQKLQKYPLDAVVQKLLIKWQTRSGEQPLSTARFVTCTSAPSHRSLDLMVSVRSVAVGQEACAHSACKYMLS